MASPGWHGEILAARRSKIESGAATFVPLNDRKDRSGLMSQQEIRVVEEAKQDLHDGKQFYDHLQEALMFGFGIAFLRLLGGPERLIMMQRESYRICIMTQLTLRGFDPELERQLRELAARDHLSLNKAALKLMRRGAGLESEPVPARNLGERLQRFAGRLSAEEAQAIDNVIHDSRDQDKKLQA